MVGKAANAAAKIDACKTFNFVFIIIISWLDTFAECGPRWLWVDASQMPNTVATPLRGESFVIIIRR